jgi:hypothetical protein
VTEKDSGGVELEAIRLVEAAEIKNLVLQARLEFDLSDLRLAKLGVERDEMRSARRGSSRMAAGYLKRCNVASQINLCYRRMPAL